MDSQDAIKTQIGENLRFYSDMRFKQLTLLMAWLTFAGLGAFNYGTQKVVDSIEIRALLSCISIFFIGMLWVMEVRSTIHWSAQRAISPDIWPLPKNPFWKFLRASNVVVTLYSVMFVLWIWLGHLWGIHFCLTIAFVILWTILMIDTIVNYIRAFSDSKVFQ